MHCDTTSVILKKRVANADDPAGLLENDLHIDAKRLKQAEYMCQCFAMFTAKFMIEKSGLSPLECLLRQNEIWDSEMEKCSEFIRPAFSGSDIEKNFSEGYVSALKTIEEGLVYMGNPDNLKLMYEKGVRMSTLTWNFENELAFPNFIMWETEDGKTHTSENENIPSHDDSTVKRLWFVPDTKRGLKQTGRDFIKLMEEMGMIIDMSHLNDAGISDILGLVHPDTPVIASHSNARAITNHSRNLTDDFIRQIADHGGVCGINFCSEFLNDRKDDMSLISDMSAHIKHMKKVGGIDVIGLGSDHDGIDNRLETQGCQGIQMLADALLADGFTYDEVEKIMFRNVLRVFKDVLG